MIYRFYINTPKNTSRDNQVQTVLPLVRGIIHQVDFAFPSGPSGYLHLNIHHALHQIWPSNTGEYFAANNDIIRFREFYPLLQEPYQLEAYTYNEDDTYDHRVLIRLGLLPAHIIAPWLLTFEERIAAILGVE